MCKDVHTAWSNACPARKKEMGRVEQAKQTQSIYWHVPARENTARPGSDNAPITDTSLETVPSGEPALREAASAAIRTTDISAQSRQELTTAPTETYLEAYAPVGTIVAAAAATTGTVPVEEEWATPATQQDLMSQQPDATIDPRLMAVEKPFTSQIPTIARHPCILWTCWESHLAGEMQMLGWTTCSTTATMSGYVTCPTPCHLH